LQSGCLEGRRHELRHKEGPMKFAAGLTITGILSFLVLEALKIIMVPVTTWVLGLLVLAVKLVLIVLVVGLVIGVGIFLYKRQQKMMEEV
jgi:Flp pilus assembly protein TadB